MKKIASIPYLGKARNAEHYHLQEQFMAIVTTAFAVDFKINGFRTNYEELFKKEDALYLQSTAYADTKIVEEKDVVRDTRYRYIDLTVQGKLLSLAPSDQKSAERISFVMSSFVGCSSKPYAENTAMVSDLAKKLQSDEYAADVAALGLTEAVAAMKTANDEFEAVYSKRADQKLIRENSEKLKKVRPEVDKAFRLLADAINALYLVAETIDHDEAKAAEIGAVIDALNARILQFSETLSRRGVGAKAKFDPETPPDLNPDQGGGEEERPGEL